VTVLLLGCLAAWSSLDGDGDGTSFLDGDCDDRNPAIGPHVPELWYDGIDQDCDGGSDYDADGDGFDALLYGGEDCDDSRPSYNPDALEHWYDGRDQDCAGDDDYDADLDGTPWPEDCNDQDFGINPGASETWYDGIDQDCDGRSDYDIDGDGYLATQYGGSDCKDGDPEVHPGAPDSWYDCEDSNCDANDGDQDGDGYVPDDYGCDWTLFAAHRGLGDCWDDPSEVPANFDAINGQPQPTAGDVYPDARDAVYDGVDGDCAGRGSEFDADGDGADSASIPDRDDNLGVDCDDADPAVIELTWYEDTDGDSYGDPLASTSQCTAPSTNSVMVSGDCDDTSPSVNPDGSEVCGGGDEDCDNSVDESTAVDAPSWYDDADDDGYGDPTTPQVSCDPPSAESVSNGDDCDDANDSINPGKTELCDPSDIDEDCNGLADDYDREPEGTTEVWLDSDGDGYGDRNGASLELCDPTSAMSTVATDCNDDDPAVNPGASETCSTDDDDNCDDIVNEDCYIGGELILSELQHDPLGAEPTDQYIEIYNTTALDIYADGLRIDVGSSSWFIAPDGLVIPAQDRSVLCYSDAVLGSTCGYVYGSDTNGSSQAGNTYDSSIDLQDSGSLTLSIGTTTLDTVSWSSGGSWPTAVEGRSLELGPAAQNALDNNDGSNWCLATATYSGSEMGSPGIGPSCAP